MDYIDISHADAPRPTFEEACAFFASLFPALRISAGSWEDEHTICIFSVEGEGAAYFGHARAAVNWSRASGYLTARGTNAPAGQW